MGHGKETPRQKMIGMMYLVLLALLAMNVSAEILNAFVLVDNSLKKSEASTLEKNNAVLSDFVKAYELNPKGVKEWKDKADITSTAANELIAEITELQKLVVATADGSSEEYEKGNEDFPEGGTAAISKKDTKDEGTMIMIEQGKGEELQNKVEALRAKLIGMVPAESGVARSIAEILDTEPTKNTEGDMIPWAQMNFSEMPLVATITMLTKLKSDVRNAESDMLKYLKAQIGVDEIKFNKIEAVVNAPTASILQGEKYSARVFIAASDSTLTPTVEVNGKPLAIENGQGVYEVTGSSPGEQTWKGVIKMLNKNTGDTLKYPFESTYNVAVPSVSISPTKMNVFYIGVDNPVDVVAAGVLAKDISVSVSNGGTIRPSGKGYIVKVKKMGKVKVSVTANGKSLGSKEFRCKMVPDPIATIGKDKKNWRGGIMPKKQLANMRVNATLQNFDFDLKFKIVSHTISATIKGFDETAKGTGSRFNAKQKQIISKQNKNKRVIVDDIRASGPDGSVRRLGSLVYKVK